MNSTQNLNSLPDLCLLTIFDRIPLDDLTRNIGHVCHRWYSLEKSACARRRRLDLFVYCERYRSICKSKPQQYNNNYPGIQLKSIGNSVTENVITHFRNVTSLSIEERCFSDDPVISCIALADLFTHQWSTKLVELKLSNTFLPNGNSTILIVNAINNNLPSLKRLSLKYAFDHQCTFPIVAQLEEFKCNLPFNAKWLKKYAEGDTALRRIEIALPEHDRAIESYLKLCPQFARKFVGFNTENCLKIDDLLLARFCSHFISLEKMQIYIESDVAKHLSYLYPLKKLKSLYLNLSDLGSIQDASAQLEIVPFESVCTLSFTLYHSFDDALELMNSINFAHLFPNLEIVYFYSDYDDNEEYLPNKHESFREHQESHFRTLMQPLLKCKQMFKIAYYSVYNNRFNWRKDFDI